MKSLIDSRFHKYIHHDIVTKKINAKELLTSERLDLSVKYRLAKHILFENHDYESITLYKKHLEIISNNTFLEPGDSNKNTFDNYLESFRELIESIRTIGLDSTISIIPVSKSGIPLDGAHRIAICALLDLDITIAYLNVEDFKYDVDFFKSRFTDQELIDTLFLNYINITNENLALVIEWPMDLGLEKSIIDTYSDSIIYKKSITLPYNGIKNIMLMNYWGESWLQGEKFNNAGIHNKAIECFKKGVTKFYWVKNINLDKRIFLKNQLRESLGVSKHSIHSTDSQEECINVSRSILNESSLQMLNMIEPEKCSRSLNMLLSNKVELNQDVLVGGSFILALLGLRDATDIDVITACINSEVIDTHNKYIELYDFDNISSIYEDSSYYYYFGIKFVSLNHIVTFKKRRDEFKDKQDILLLESFITGGGDSLKIKIKKLYFSTMRKILFLTIKIIKKVGMKDVIKKIFKVS